MNKELKALENIKHYDSRVGLHESDYKIIENALKHLEILEQELCVVKTMEDLTIEAIKDKKLKALEIVKEKEVNVFDILATGYVEYYNMCVVNKIRPEYCDSYFLTQEEYELLKEVLE